MRAPRALTLIHTAIRVPPRMEIFKAFQCWLRFQPLLSACKALVLDYLRYFHAGFSDLRSWYPKASELTLKGFSGTNILWRSRPRSITPLGCPPQRCAAEQPRQWNASPGRVPFLCSPTSLSHRRRNSKDARDVSMLVDPGVAHATLNRRV